MSFNHYFGLARRLCGSYGCNMDNPENVAAIIDRSMKGESLDIPQIFPKKWFDENFDGVKVPSDIRYTAENLCNAYNINGICDPVYISNIIALETGRGDGCSNFFN